MATIESTVLKTSQDRDFHCQFSPSNPQTPLCRAMFRQQAVGVTDRLLAVERFSKSFSAGKERECVKVEHCSRSSIAFQTLCFVSVHWPLRAIILGAENTLPYFEESCGSFSMMEAAAL